MAFKKSISRLARLAENVGIVAFDIGARGGTLTDLLPIAEGVTYYGFEPDPTECARLNALPPDHPWKSVKYFDYALSSDANGFSLNLYKQRGCSSRYVAKTEIARRYSREDYYELQDTVTVRSRSLDEVISEVGIAEPHFIKIDVQGMELDVFRGGSGALENSTLAIRTEVSFFEMYEGQPLHAEIDQALRTFGFSPMRFLEFHEWRRSTRAKLPRLGRSPVPFSRGQMAHGDVLYLKHPEDLEGEGDEHLRQFVRLGLLAVCYEHLDHALAAFERPSVRDFCRSAAGVDPVEEVYSLSRTKSRGYAGVLGLTRRALLHWMRK